VSDHQFDGMKIRRSGAAELPSPRPVGPFADDAAGLRMQPSAGSLVLTDTAAPAGPVGSTKKALQAARAAAKVAPPHAAIMPQLSPKRTLPTSPQLKPVESPRQKRSPQFARASAGGGSGEGAVPPGEYLGVWKEHLTLFPRGNKPWLYTLHEGSSSSPRKRPPSQPPPQPSTRLTRLLPSVPPVEASPRSGFSHELLRQQMHLEHGLTDEQIVGQLRKVNWFKTLPHKDLQSLYQRGHHRFFTRYSTILREGNEGAYFYVLLQGQVRCTSVVNGLNVVLGAGSSFGEGALVTKVRREASVTALEDCYLLQFVAEDVAGFAVDLGDVRSHVIALILEKVHFFRTLTHAQRESLSLFMDVEYFTAGMKVFDEGDDGDKFYIVIEGCVNMYKRAAVSGREELVADYATHDERPWFGELALWNSTKQKRACTAISTEPTKAIVVNSAHFAGFLDIAPHFGDMFAASASAYQKLNLLRQENEELAGGMSILAGLLERARCGALEVSLPTMALTKNEEGWKRLVMVMMVDQERGDDAELT